MTVRGLISQQRELRPLCPGCFPRSWRLKQDTLFFIDAERRLLFVPNCPGVSCIHPGLGGAVPWEPAGLGASDTKGA